MGIDADDEFGPMPGHDVREQLPGFEHGAIPPVPKVTGTIEVEGKKIKPKKVSKKHKKKGRSLRDMAYETMSPSNVITRDDMARGAHKPERGAANAAFAHSGNRGNTSKEAVAIISEGPTLELTFRQWDVVQYLIEQGLRRGYQLGQEAAARLRLPGEEPNPTL